jgi:hypothetical protein
VTILVKLPRIISFFGIRDVISKDFTSLKVYYHPGIEIQISSLLSDPNPSAIPCIETLFPIFIKMSRNVVMSFSLTFKSNLIFDRVDVRRHFIDLLSGYGTVKIAFEFSQCTPEATPSAKLAIVV